MTDERAARVLGSLRDGWHGMAGGDARACPGCPVCALTEQAGRLDPATTAHLHAAVGHLAAAGRELLAVLGTGHGPAVQDPGRGGPDAGGPRWPADDPVGEDRRPPTDPATAPVATWTRIPVSTPQIDEEHP